MTEVLAFKRVLKDLLESCGVIVGLHAVLDVVDGSDVGVVGGLVGPAVEAVAVSVRPLDPLRADHDGRDLGSGDVDQGPEGRAEILILVPSAAEYEGERPLEDAPERVPGEGWYVIPRGVEAQVQFEKDAGCHGLRYTDGERDQARVREFRRRAPVVGCFLL